MCINTRNKRRRRRGSHTLRFNAMWCVHAAGKMRKMGVSGREYGNPKYHIALWRYLEDKIHCHVCSRNANRFILFTPQTNGLFPSININYWAGWCRSHHSQSTHLTWKSISRKASQTQTAAWIEEHRTRSHLKVDTFDDCSTFGTERMSISVTKAVINTFTWIKIPFSSQVKTNLCRFQCLKCEDLLLFLC